MRQAIETLPRCVRRSEIERAYGAYRLQTDRAAPRQRGERRLWIDGV